jgi:hypothetical protein
LSDKRKEEVEKEYERVKSINDELNGIEDELADIGSSTVKVKGKKTNNDA